MVLRKAIGWRAAGATFIAFCLLAAAFTATRRHLSTDSEASATRGGDKNAAELYDAYSKYKFGQTDSVIDIGVQPLWIPANMIAEALQRDRILRRDLGELGMEARFHPFLKGSDANYFLWSGDLEAVYAGDMPALVAAAEGEVAVAALAQQGFCSIVARRHLLLGELRGKRIGYAHASNAHYALLRALSDVGLGEEDCHLIPLDVIAMSASLAEGTIDAFAAWEPTVFLAETRYSDQVVIHRSLTSGFLYFDGAFAGEQAEAVRRVVAAHLRAVRWLANDANQVRAAHWTNGAARAVSIQHAQITTDEILRLAESDLLGTPSVPFIPKSALVADGPLFEEYSFLRETGMISSAVKWETIRASFQTPFLDEIMTDPTKYRTHLFDYSGREATDDDSVL